MPRPVFLLLTFAHLLLLPTLVANSDDEIKLLERQLKDRFVGKVLTLRHFNSGVELRFNTEGRLMEGGAPGPWTVDGRIEVINLKLGHNRLEILAHRLSLHYNRETKQFRQVRGPNRVRVVVESQAATQDGSDLAEGATKVFLSGDDDLANFLPAYWQDFVSKGAQDNCNFPEQAARNGDSVYRIKGNSVTAPRCKSCADPEYTEAARHARVNGSLLLCGIVNREGEFEEVQVATPFGFGLDDAAVNRVLQWKFEPAKRNGEPVSVFMQVEISFRRWH